MYHASYTYVLQILDFLGMFRAGLFGLLSGLGVLALFMLVFISRHDRILAAASRTGTGSIDAELE